MNALKRLIIGTPLEGAARALFVAGRRLTSRGTVREWDLRTSRDAANVELRMQSVLTATSSCVDIGAHKGVFLRRFLELSPRGHHFAFEPLPHLAEALRVEFPTVEVIACALGDRTGRVSFQHVLDHAAWSGLKKQWYPTDVEIAEIVVDLRRLDDVLPPDLPVDFIKIDVEGAELEVLRGAEMTIRRHRPWILFEHAKIHDLEYGTTPEMIYDILVREHGLGIYRLDDDVPLTLGQLQLIYDSSFESNYDRTAQTNFLARGQEVARHRRRTQRAPRA
jgi:FkbM family methyltransferase